MRIGRTSDCRFFINWYMKPGTCYITYYCVDSADQHAQASIRVIVEEGS